MKKIWTIIINGIVAINAIYSIWFELTKQKEKKYV